MREVGLERAKDRQQIDRYVDRQVGSLVCRYMHTKDSRDDEESSS